jgi:putative ABC transport system permease protein
VIGIVKDFYFQPLYASIGPVLLTDTQDNYALLYTKFKEAARPEALAFVKSALDEYFPEESHAPVFLEDRLAALYKRESSQEALLSFFSTLAVVIAGLGILGLSAFSVERRTREIGIRKILGAKTGRLYLLLSGNFAGLLAIANILGWPAAFYFANRWLSQFAYHVPVRMGTFLSR